MLGDAMGLVVYEWVFAAYYLLHRQHSEEIRAGFIWGMDKTADKEH